MDAPATLHPSDQTLLSYGLGKLDVVSAEAVHCHLEACADCRRRIGEISADSFLGRLGDAQAGPPVPRQPTVGASRGGGGPPSPAPPRTTVSVDTRPPELIDQPQYEILRELGRGGMGIVYLARNRLMDRLEVLKVLNREMLDRSGTLDRFLREIRSAARLHHPNVVSAYSALQLGHLIVFAMEYVDGLDLAKMVKAKGPMPVGHATYFIHQAALGLQHAHEQGMVHRDIKPGNLMLTRKGNRGIVKVLDFGLAKATREESVDGGLTQEGQILGTPDFIAPEQTRDAQKADIRADIYSLGCSLYYLLSGGPPFRGTSLYDILQAHHSIDANPLNLVRTDVPVELAALVAKMMAKEPETRFQTPGEVAKALTPFFKAGKAASKVSNAGLSQAGRPADTPTAAEVSSAPTPRASSARQAAAKRDGSKPAEPAIQWNSLIDFGEKERAAERLAVAPEPHRRGTRARRVIIAAASVLTILVLGLVLFVATDQRRGKHVVDVSKTPGKTSPPGASSRGPLSVRSNSASRYALRFDPEWNSVVRINSLRYDGSHSITLEAYVRPLASPAPQSTILSDAEGAGVELGILADGRAYLSAYASGKSHIIESTGSLVGKRSHLAGVLAGGRLSLFVNGKRAGFLNLPGPFQSSPLPFYVGGKPNRDGGAGTLFNGIIEQVRISNSARYSGNFDPEEVLGADANTLLLYEFDRETDQIASDASGHRRHGMIAGAELVLLIDAPLTAKSPVADGKISDGEYGPPLKVDFATRRNPGRIVPMNTEGRNWSETVPPQDLSFELYSAHTARSLFLAFRVTDDFIDDEIEENNRIYNNDCVELYIDGDRVPNDFAAPHGNLEGFQLLSDALGRQMTTSDEILSNKDWRVATNRVPDGYVIEFEIPLAKIDTADGAPYIPATTGSLLWFNAAVNDNDAAVHRQDDYGVLWLVGESGLGGAPVQGEKFWRVGLCLSGPLGK